jgi:starch-binding outer membrane protein SusE/F
MNNINKIILPALVLVIFAACKKNESEITYSGGGTAPVLSASVPGNSVFVLSPSDSTSQAITLSWTNPNYTFSNGISSLDVNYTLEIDTVGSNFTNPKLVQITFASDLSTSFTVANLNSQLFAFLDLQTGVPHNIAMRVVSFLNSASLPLYSNTLTYTITPYAIPPAVAPPPNDSLYIVGAAIAADNWANPMPAAVIPSATFTEVTPTLYTITTPLVGGGEYKLIANNNGSWTYQWSVAAQDTYPNGGPFVFNGNNCIAPATSGIYTIAVNFQSGYFTVTLQ